MTGEGSPGKRPRGRPVRSTETLTDLVRSPDSRALIASLQRLITSAHGSRTTFVREAQRRGYDITNQKVSNAFGGRPKNGPDWDLAKCIVYCCVETDGQRTWELARVAALWSAAHQVARPPGYDGILLPPQFSVFQDDEFEEDEHLNAATQGMGSLQPYDGIYASCEPPDAAPLALNCDRGRGLLSGHFQIPCWILLLTVTASSTAIFLSNAIRSQNVIGRQLYTVPFALSILLVAWLRVRRLAADIRFEPIDGNTPVKTRDSFIWSLPPRAALVTTFRQRPRRTWRMWLWRQLQWSIFLVPKPPLACVHGKLTLSDPDNLPLILGINAPPIPYVPNPAGHPIIEWMITIGDQTLLAIGVLSQDHRTAYSIAADNQVFFGTEYPGEAALANITLAHAPTELRLLLRRIDDYDSTAEIAWRRAGLHVHYMY
jgi:hypothetical protein